MRFNRNPPSGLTAGTAAALAPEEAARVSPDSDFALRVRGGAGLLAAGILPSPAAGLAPTGVAGVGGEGGIKSAAFSWAGPGPASCLAAGAGETSAIGRVMGALQLRQNFLPCIPVAPQEGQIPTGLPAGAPGALTGFCPVSGSGVAVGVHSSFGDGTGGGATAAGSGGAARLAPHWTQNFAVSGSSDWHCGQFTTTPIPVA